MNYIHSLYVLYLTWPLYLYHHVARGKCHVDVEITHNDISSLFLTFRTYLIEGDFSGLREVTEVLETVDEDFHRFSQFQTHLQ